MKDKYVDFHLHSSQSDGMKQPEEVIAEAKCCGISLLALTDHNMVTDVSKLRLDNPSIKIVTGCEFSCLYNGAKEIHVVGLGFDENHPKIHNILQHNQSDREPYVTAIIKALEKLDIFIGNYDHLKADYPDSLHIGRSHIANKMMRLGYVNTAEEAFDEYIGDFGNRRAYVPSQHHYASIEDTVDAILSAGGVAVLAHLFYYRGNDAFNRELVSYFKQLTKERGAMETSYGRYSEEERIYLRKLADEYELMHSAASDYHGKDDSETLNYRFKQNDFQPLINMLFNLGGK